MSLDAKVFDSGVNPPEFIWMKSAAARAKGDLVWVTMTSSGFTDVSVSSSATVRKAAVASHAIDSGAWGLYQVKGECYVTVPSATYTDGHGLETDGGVIEDSGAAVLNGKTLGDVTATDFAVVMGTQASVTSCKCCLIGENYTSTT